MKPATVNLPSIVLGDTWPGFTATLTSDGTTFFEPLDSARVFFRAECGTGDALLELTTDPEGGLTIDSAENWTISADEITQFPLAAGSYVASLETTNTEGRVFTPIKFRLSVISDPTN